MGEESVSQTSMVPGREWTSSDPEGSWNLLGICGICHERPKAPRGGRKWRDNGKEVWRVIRLPEHLQGSSSTTEYWLPILTFCGKRSGSVPPNNLLELESGGGQDKRVWQTSCGFAKLPGFIPWLWKSSFIVFKLGRVTKRINCRTSTFPCNTHAYLGDCSKLWGRGGWVIFVWEPTRTLAAHHFM